MTATPTNEDATVAIKVGTTDVTNGGNATWADGANSLTITVTDQGQSKTYTVTVTKGD